MDSSARIGSMEEAMVPQSPPLNRNSVMAAMTRTVDSGRTPLRASSRVDIDTQSMTWALFMVSREAMFNPVILRLTLRSPITVKSRLTDMAKLKNCSKANFDKIRSDKN